MTDLAKAMAELDEEGVDRLVQEYLNQGRAPEEIIADLSAGMDEVGDRYRRGEYFLTELIYSGEIFKNTVNRVPVSRDPSAQANSKGVVVVGTVQGDIHDLGKNIVVTMLRCAGFTVVDIGVDAPPQRFLEAAVESKAALVCMSMLLTTVFDAARGTIAAFTKANLRDKVKIMIGGAPTNENVMKDMGADFWGRDATSAVEIARKVYQ